MTDFIVTDTELTNVANAIRAKGGTVAGLEWPAGYIAAINAIPTGGGVTIVDWATGTDEEVAAMIDAAHAGTIDLQQDGGWAVGDTRTISISAFSDGSGTNIAAQSVDIVLSSFDEYMSCGNILQFDFKNALTPGIIMNANNNSNGGYGASKMSVSIMPLLIDAMPSWIKTRLIEFSVLASAGGTSASIVTVTGNKLALRSEVEILGAEEYSAPGQGSQIPYYAIAANRIKKLGISGSADSYWTRSPYKPYNSGFCRIKDDGTSASGGASTKYGCAPFGCM